jgi:L-alanine-DL-glutamate epimerase-like enolase superfamily enzyme
MKGNETVVVTVREAVGDEVDVAGDAYMSRSVRYAKEMTGRLERYDVAWVEEPVFPDGIDGDAEVREAALMPIAGAEHEFTRWGYRERLGRDAIDNTSGEGEQAASP